ncbi:MAG: ABC transporter ATP-binding protein [Oscillospiraceae bacterium]|nr:ABC transporter ATP-binding protein [Oscillospiraceae bacterium]
MADTILEVRDLSITFFTKQGRLPTVDGLSFSLERGETLGIVGESGCGKSMTVNGILQMVPPPGKVTGGSVKLAGEELVGMRERELCKKRGRDVAVIFQEPMTSLDPLMTCGRQISETIQAHKKVSRKEADARALELIELVGIPMPEKIFRSVPGRLSGGMRQRIVIAMALCNDPGVLICDEPTTALDVTVQAQILGLIDELKEKFGTAVIFITHDLGVIRQMADKVLVMYVGQAVEQVDAKELFANPLHPYTQGLMRCIPGMDGGDGDLHVIDGAVPMLYDLPQGCLFAPRCPYAVERCRRERPGLYGPEGHRVRCFRCEATGEGGAV